MKPSLFRARAGFTLIEIMIVVAIIALLAAIMSGNVLRARKRTQAARVLADLRTLDGAIDQWALEKNKKAGDVAQFSDVQPYLKMMSALNITGRDLFNQTYGPFSVDSPPQVADFTYDALSDVAPLEFWSPFR